MTTHDLPDLPAIPPGRYRHYKGGSYEVLGVVRHSESLEPMVLYRSLDRASGSWVRPLAMFLESVSHGGRVQPRFEWLGDPAGAPDGAALGPDGDAGGGRGGPP